MAEEIKGSRIYSQPTRCLQCHLVVGMFHGVEANTRKGAWECPNCGHKYPFAHWKIKEQGRGKTKAA